MTGHHEGETQTQRLTEAMHLVAHWGVECPYSDCSLWLMAQGHARAYQAEIEQRGEEGETR